MTDREKYMSAALELAREAAAAEADEAQEEDA